MAGRTGRRWVWLTMVLVSLSGLGGSTRILAAPAELDLSFTKPTPASVPGTPRLIVPRTASAPVIDGRLDDAAWRSAVVVRGFWKAGRPAPAEDQTIAWLTFDDDHLYLAFACQDRKVVGDFAMDRDAKLVWMHDAVEVHLSPTGQADHEYQLTQSVGGGRYDQYNGVRGAKPVTWNADPDWQGAAQRQSFGYTAEMRIPLAAVVDRAQVDVARGTVWNLKLTRLDFSGGADCQLTSWTPIGDSTSDQFASGELVFEDENLLSNGSAESRDSTGAPTGWEVAANHCQVMLTSSDALPDPTDGRRAARIEVRGEPTPGMNARVYPGPLAPQRSNVERTYRFRADVRTEAEPGALVAYFVVFNGQQNSQLKFPENKPWTTVEALITVEPGQKLQLPALQTVPSRAGKPQTPGGVIWLDNVRVDRAPATAELRDPNMRCLTGNATGPFRTRNEPVPGRYTYTEPGIDAPQFPNWLRDDHPTETPAYAGWIDFNRGILTDGLTATLARWALFWVGPSGKDVLIDLGTDYLVQRVVVLGDGVGYTNVHLKAANAPRYTTAAGTYPLQGFEQSALPQVNDGLAKFGPLDQPARYVRVQVATKSAAIAEVQVWGQPLKTPVESWTATQLAARPMLRQNDGKVVNAQPTGAPVSYDDLPLLFPQPQQITTTHSAWTLPAQLTIAYDPAGGARAQTTAEVLAEELQLTFGITANLAPGSAGQIVLGESTDTPDHAQSYRLTCAGSSVHIAGRDPHGTFNGAMALLSLIRPSAAGGYEVPGVTINDWPTLALRYIQGRPQPSLELIRALARFHVTHYEAQARFQPQAALWDAQAARYFIEFVPALDFNRTVLGVDASLVEYSPDESLDSIGHGRRNANPAHPRTWEIYAQQCQQWLPKFHSRYVFINLDETYQTAGGARWNVSPESRALNKSAGDLLAWMINRIDGILKQYGKSIVMHDTAFMRDHQLSYPGDPNPGWMVALPQLPRDAMFLIWHPKEVNDLLAQAGRPQLYLSLDEEDWRKLPLPEPYAGLAAYMAESSFTPAKLLALVGAAWNPTAPRAPDERAMRAIAAATDLWSQVYEGRSLPSRRAVARDFQPLDLRAAANRSRVDEQPYDGKGWVDLGANADLRALASGTIKCARIPFAIIDEAGNDHRGAVMVQNAFDANRVLPSEVRLDTPPFRAASLAFLHTLEHRPGHNYLKRNELAGFYHILYADGQAATCEIKYAVNTANWTGRPTPSGYNPKGHNMTNGYLAWQGETAGGMGCFLYATEWVNPRPGEPIIGIVLRAAQTPSNMNPILLAVTAVSDRVADKSAATDEQALIPVLPWSALQPEQPRGQPLDLAGGSDESEIRYRAPDGTIISAPSIYNATADHIRWDVLEYRSYVGMVNMRGGFLDARTLTVAYDFPQPRQLTGALVLPASRSERKTENFPAVWWKLIAEVSDDGTTWREVAQRPEVCPELQGPVWLNLPDVPVQHLRFRAELLRGNANGFNWIELYQS